MERETLRVEFVTPCFLGGTTGSTEWRAASIRGQLRWWFRAVAGATRSLAEISEAESLIFGSPVRKALLKVQALEAPVPVTTRFERQLTAASLAERWGDRSAETQDRLRIMADDRERRSDPLQYLGYGAIGRGYFPAGKETSFRLQWGPGRLSEASRLDFDDALWAWLNLGGLGAKSRKGFGSVRLVSSDSTERFLSPKNREELSEKVRGLLGKASKEERAIAWTHFSHRSKLFLAKGTATSWEEAMEWLGSWLIGFRRRYGYPKDMRTLGALPLANRDYEWAAPKGKDPRKEFPDRSGFGLPLPFRRERAGETVTWGSTSKEAKDGDSRRASPLLLHVACFGEKSYVPVLTYLPAQFLPAEGRLKFKGQRISDKKSTPEIDTVVDRFLDDLVEKKLIEKVEAS